MNLKLNKTVGPQVRRDAKSKESKLISVLAALSLIGGLQAATQFFAYTFGYQATLSGHIGHHVYMPWSILQWAAKWYKAYPNEFMKAGSLGVIFTSICLFFLILIKFSKHRLSTKEYLLEGSARWADKKDIQDAGLLPCSRGVLEIVTGKNAPVSAGVYVGGWEDKNGKFHYLRNNGPEHVLAIGPTRSGKGVGLVIPTLLSWPESAIITDLKGELWPLTAGWRKKHAGNKVLRFEPASSSGSVFWNPLDEIRFGTENEVGDAQNLAALIADQDGRGLDSHRHKTAAFLTELILYTLNKARDEGASASLASVDAMLGEMIHSGKYTVRPGDDSGLVLSTAKACLALYRDPVVAMNTSKSDFRIKDLIDHDTPISLYIVTQPNDKTRLQPLVRVMISMALRLLSGKMEFEQIRNSKRPLLGHLLERRPPVLTRIKKTYKHRLLCMLDEFPGMGKISNLEETLTCSSGYGIKFYIVCQDINQLKNREKGYGPEETITSSCHIKNAFPPTRVETAEHLSWLTGQITVLKEQIATIGRTTALVSKYVSRSYQEIKRPLLTADEYIRLPVPRRNDSGEIKEAGDMVIHVTGYPAIYGKQPLYFKDPIFQSRAAVPAPNASDTLNQVQDAGEWISIHD